MLSSMTSGLLATLAFVGVAGGQMSAPLNVSISTPSSGSLVGKNGLGWNVDFVLSSAAMNSSMALSVANGYLPGYSAPGSTTFKPGHSAFAPGLVVLCGTTVNSTAFPGGPNTNLAGLLQLNAITGTISTDVFSSFRYGWQVGAALFGLGVPSNLTIFVVNGTAPDIYSATNSSAIISNVAHVSFNISSNVTAPAVANSTMPAYTTSIIAPKKGDKAGRAGANWLVDILVNSNSSEAFTKNNATLPLFNAVNSSTFKPGPSAAVPGLVVLLNTTTNASAPFMGPMTNLAGLFQINAITGNRGPGSVNQVQLMWQVLKSITTPNATSLLSVYMVNGTAPLLVNATSAPELPGSRSDIAFTVAS